MPFQKVEYDHLLTKVLKPARYINEELNSFHKPLTRETINFCLAFPDVYEIGFSHLGLKILYSILNQQEDAVADRVYAPWQDFGELLLEEKLPLFALESRIALKDFDVIGFTLQTELNFTNVLYILDLANIPLFSEQRTSNDPIIIAGGPSAVNPHPLKNFIDAFLIGDGEDAILDIKDCLKKYPDREKRLQNLAKLKGIYIPALHSQKDIIRIRKFTDFNDPEKMHSKQMMPWLMPTHYRYMSEIMRGCTKGCRFCFAGMFYRPVRERDQELVVRNILKELKENGWHEASLTSLSSSDYTGIKDVLLELAQYLGKFGLSLPSLRIDSIENDLIELMNAMQQKSFTIAPEAGSQRLRDIINKNISEAEIFNSIKIAMQNNWQQMKLYFMIGLPFEKDSDIQAIIDLVEEIVEFTHKKMRINITLSPFVPKPFTPFQWAAMRSKSYILEKINRIKTALRVHKFVKIKYHNLNTSLLECIIGRGGEQIGKLIYEAYTNGASFDNWEECFRFADWQKAAAELNIDLAAQIKELDPDQLQVWENIDIGISKKFLLKEYEKAAVKKTTSDCRDGECLGCGLCDEKIKPDFVKKRELEEITLPEDDENDNRPNIYYRVFFSKMDRLRFVSHLDLMRMLHNVLRAINLPVVFSHGYNIHPRLSLCSPLPLGVEGENEYFDFIMKEEFSSDKVISEFKRKMPHSLPVKNVEILKNKKMRGMDYYQLEKLLVQPGDHPEEIFRNKTANFMQCTQFPIQKRKKNKIKKLDLKDIIQKISWKDDELIIVKKCVGASIFDILEHVYGIQREQTNKFRIIRKGFIHREN